jgi:hypothetical protein
MRAKRAIHKVKWVIFTGLAIALTACATAANPPAPTATAITATDLPPTELSSTMTPQPTAIDNPGEAPTVASMGDANADVTYVRAVQDADGTWTFHVTVAHPDTGWEDYADGWDVLTPDDEVLLPDPEAAFTRVLLHPHVDEQPFTRSQAGIEIPAEVEAVMVRAHDLVDGFGGREVTVDLTRSTGDGYEVEHSD